MTLHHGNPFGVVRNWFTLREGPQAAWPLFVQVTIIAGVMMGLFGLRATFRLKGHFHDRHYKPLESDRIDQSEHIGERPLSWWAVRRVMEYSGRVNVWLAGGFCFLYSAYIIAGDHWPPWMGRLVFQIFESWGGAAVVATAMSVLAAVPGGLPVWALGLVHLRPLQAARTAAALRPLRPRLLAGLARGGVAARLRLPHLRGDALGLPGRVGTGRVAQRAGRRDGRVATVGVFLRGWLSRLLDRASCERIGFDPHSRLPSPDGAPHPRQLESLAAFLPTALCYLPLKSGLTETWLAGFAVTLAITISLTDRGLSHCDRELRAWYDANQGRKTE